MAGKIKYNLVGQIYGRLKVESIVSKRNLYGHIMWLCKCECGNYKEVLSASLRTGKTRSCGCYNDEIRQLTNTIHGHSSRFYKSPSYQCWDAIIQRCTNKKHKQYKDYGGRGIVACDRWLDFKLFLQDMGEKPSSSYSIERIDNNLGYYKENCKWATREQQSRNKRNNVWITYNSEKLIITDWANRLKTQPSIIRRSINRGKTFDEIVKYYQAK